MQGLWAQPSGQRRMQATYGNCGTASTLRARPTRWHVGTYANILDLSGTAGRAEGLLGTSKAVFKDGEWSAKPPPLPPEKNH